ncbi:Gfo/Idh/MocA family protein [Dellaglioa sp. P0083]|uniref:Gfo/Idh/MocA family protein n=1 Tax=Dellaglioa kimchii TaxID=3344667 RepID=UPI0038D45BFF
MEMEIRTMNFGIIGYGNIAKRFYESIRHTKNGQVTAIGSKSLFNDHVFKAENPNLTIYDSYQALLGDDSIDGVYIALPHLLHKEWSLKVLKLNIPVFCEKPAVLTTTDMKEIELASRENKTLFVEAFKTKFNSGMDHLKQDLALIGPIQTMSANFCSNAIPSQKATSYLLQKGQGGALNDIGTYPIGFVLDILGSDISRIESKLDMHNGIDEKFSATIHFETGAQAFIEGAINEAKPRVAIIVGQQGRIVIPMYNRIEKYTIELNGGQKIERDYNIVGDDMTLEIQAFINLVETGAKTCERHSLQDTFNIIQVIEKIRQGE